MSSTMYKKLNKTLINDKKFNSYELCKILNAEFIRVLTEYANVLPQSQVNIDITESGEYNITFVAQITRVKNYGFLN